MGLGGIAVRCLVAFGFLLLMTRLKGKHAVSESTAFDFVLAMTLGEMVDDFILSEVPATQFIVGAGTLVFADLFTTYGAQISQLFYRWSEGVPRVIMTDGKAREKDLRAEQMNRADVEHCFRLKGMDRDRFEEVRMGILENDSQLSMLLHDWARPVSRQEAQGL